MLYSEKINIVTYGNENCLHHHLIEKHNNITFEMMNTSHWDIMPCILVQTFWNPVTAHPINMFSQILLYSDDTSLLGCDVLMGELLPIFQRILVLSTLSIKQYSSPQIRQFITQNTVSHFRRLESSGQNWSKYKLHMQNAQHQ